MPILICEKCGKSFMRKDEEVSPIIAGKTGAFKGLMMHIDKSCPHCGHNQEEERLMLPL
jgi:rubrerythrin